MPYLSPCEALTRFFEHRPKKNTLNIAERSKRYVMSVLKEQHEDKVSVGENRKGTREKEKGATQPS